MHNKTYYVYILSSQKDGTLYVGVTNNLIRRIWEHQTGIIEGFTKKYHVHHLMYFEQFENIEDAIAREKYIKGKKRKYKTDLIEKDNPNWDDLKNIQE